MHQDASRRPVLRFTNNLVQMYPLKTNPLRSQNMSSHEVTTIGQKIKKIFD